MNKKINEHWNHIYATTPDNSLGWYEKDSNRTFVLIEEIENWNSCKYFISGAGTTSLVTKLLKSEVDMVLNDISSVALNKLKNIIEDNPNNNSTLTWLLQDISQPISSDIPLVDVWIDRAVLHFLLDENQIEQYFKNVNTQLKVGGYAIFAEFSKTGATSCASLDIKQYCTDDLSMYLGKGYELCASFEHTYINPNKNERPYIYALYRRVL